MREYHVRFCERLGLKCPCLLDYAAQASGLSTRDNIEFAISQHISTLVLMSVKYKFRNQEQLYFVTLGGLIRLFDKSRVRLALACAAYSRQSGGVFMGNQFVTTLGIAKIGRFMGIAGATIGTIIDMKGVYNYYYHPHDSNYIQVSPGQFVENLTFTAIGFMGLEGAVVSVGYFGLNAFYPGGAGRAVSDFAIDFSAGFQ